VKTLLYLAARLALGALLLAAALVVVAVLVPALGLGCLAFVVVDALPGDVS